MLQYVGDYSSTGWSYVGKVRAMFVRNGGVYGGLMGVILGGLFQPRHDGSKLREKGWGWGGGEGAPVNTALMYVN